MDSLAYLRGHSQHCEGVGSLILDETSPTRSSHALASPRAPYSAVWGVEPHREQPCSQAERLKLRDTRLRCLCLGREEGRKKRPL